MSFKSTWTNEEKELLKKLWKLGHTASEIAEEIGNGRTTDQVRMFVSRNRKELALTRRPVTNWKVLHKTTHFESLWSGPIPCGHWMITKPWTKSGSDA